MNFKNLLLSLLLVWGLIFSASAKEGMWIPTLLQKYNIEEMQQMGFKLTADDIYSVNHASMKDAVVIFGGGCTGEVISPDGLLITNHHCGYSSIQKHSSVEHDYLTDGFWAMNRDEELPNPGLTVKFLVRMDDVTAQALEGVTDSLTESEKQTRINENTAKIEKEATEGTDYTAVVKPLFYGNQYFVYVYEVYKDIRLVGSPPSAIGKFGGDTDNWMWPRHTGDFSVFRIYAGKDNKPAEYSPDNVPYKPKKFFPINMKGVKKGDFTMVFGYPGTTKEYLPSQAVKLIMAQSDPEKVAIRTKKLNILAADMEADRAVRIQYASKYARTSNSWKRWQGEVKGLKRLNAVEKKQEGEKAFTEWLNASSSRKGKYGEVLPRFEELYAEFAPYQRADDYYSEVVKRGTDIFSLAQKFDRIRRLAEYNAESRLEGAIPELKDDVVSYFKDYHQATDEKVFTALLTMYAHDLPEKWLPEELTKLTPEKLAKLYRKSVLTNETALNQMLDNFDKQAVKKLEKDPVMQLYRALRNTYEVKVESRYRELNDSIKANQKLYMAGLLEMNKGKRMMADANFTLRVAYGKVEGYDPRDGVHYKYYTTLKGIMEKDNPEIYDYDVPDRLKELYQKRDFGQYKNGKGQVPVAFCASNHTTGGNSGSPVVDAEGNLIGVNFDRTWEGTMSDIMFDPDQCRNIMLDIRYALFVIDKFAGAGYLLDEMELVN